MVCEQQGSFYHFTSMSPGKIIQIIDCSTPAGSLSSYEFVKPVQRIVQKEGFRTTVIPYYAMTGDILKETDPVILCGTALMDNEFLSHPECFAWIPGTTRPVLGICAGMEIVCLSSGGSLELQEEIGMNEVYPEKPDGILPSANPFMAYQLHRYSVIPPPEFIVLARSDHCPQVIRHRERRIYGAMFHPEVRNEWVITRFINLPIPDTL